MRASIPTRLILLPALLATLCCLHGCGAYPVSLAADQIIIETPFGRLKNTFRLTDAVPAPFEPRAVPAVSDPAPENSPGNSLTK